MLLDMMMTRGVPQKITFGEVREMGVSAHERIQHEKPDAGRTLVLERHETRHLAADAFDLIRSGKQGPRHEPQYIKLSP